RTWVEPARTVGARCAQAPQGTRSSRGLSHDGFLRGPAGGVLSLYTHASAPVGAGADVRLDDAAPSERDRGHAGVTRLVSEQASQVDAAGRAGVRRGALRAVRFGWEGVGAGRGELAWVCLHPLVHHRPDLSGSTRRSGLARTRAGSVQPDAKR